MPFFFLFTIFSRICLLRNGEWEPSPACSCCYFLRSPRLEAAACTPRARSITPVPTPAQGQAGTQLLFTEGAGRQLTWEGGQWSEPTAPGPRDPSSLSLCPAHRPGLLQPHLQMMLHVRGRQESGAQQGCGWFGPGQGSPLTPPNRVWALLPLPLCWQRDGHILFPKWLTQA